MSRSFGFQILMTIRSIPKHRRISCIQWSIFWIVTILIVSCDSSTPDSGFFSSDGRCLPPCWNDIVPGQTKKADALMVLFNSEHISPNSLGENNLRDPSVNEYHFRLKGGSNGGVIARDDIVYEVYLTPEFNLTLGTLVERFGKPDYIFVQTTNEIEVCFETQLYYPGRGIMVQLHECEKIVGAEHPSVITGEELVNNIVYFPPTTKPFEEMLLELWQPFEETAYHISAYSEPWDGYRDYQAQSYSGRKGIPQPILQ